MKLGISITKFSWPAPASELGPTIAHIARAADEAGVDSIWTMDHFFQIGITGLPPESPMPEGFTTLMFIAAHTSRIRVGTLVTAVPYRHPGVMLKTATTLDVLSGGRLTLGLGAGSPSTAGARRHEAGGLGIPFASLADRFEQLEEVLRLAHQMWAGDERPFEGTHYRLARPLNSPNTLQRPHPPILIGGGGERKTLRLVARYADACNLFDVPGGSFPDDIVHKLRVLDDHCRDAGRDPGQIERTITSFFALGDDPEVALRDLLDRLRILAAAGIDHVMLSPVLPWDDRGLDAVASILSQVHELEVAPATA
jgi:F420-dependent oxidoreductase-like protein